MIDEIKKSHNKPKPVITVKTGKPIDGPPEYLGMMGKMCYNKVVQDLVDMGVADRADSRTVEAFASAYEEYRLARIECNKGFTYQTIDSKDRIILMKRPEVEVMQNAWTRMSSLLASLYLTPSSRAKVPGTGKKEASEDWSELIPDESK